MKINISVHKFLLLQKFVDLTLAKNAWDTSLHSLQVEELCRFSVALVSLKINGWFWDRQVKEFVNPKLLINFKGKAMFTWSCYNKI